MIKSVNKEINNIQIVEQSQICGKCNKKKGLTEGGCSCGRPTNYKEEYCEEIVAWFEQEKEIIYYEESRYRPQKSQIEMSEDGIVEHGGKKATTPKIIKSMLPTFARWCFEKKIPKSTFYDWANKHEEFSESLELCKQIQEAILIEMGLNNIYNAKITELMLMNNHGRARKEKRESNVNLSIDSLIDDIIE